MKKTVVLSVLVLFLAAAASADKPGKDFVRGNPDIASIGALAFGPEGILFIGDAAGGAVFAVDLGDPMHKSEAARIDVQDLEGKIAAILGTTAKDILMHDLAANPVSQHAYISVTRGQGAGASHLLIRVTAGGEISPVSLKDVRYAKAMLPNPIAQDATDRRGRSLRSQAITDLAYSDGLLLVAGLSNEEFASALSVVPFPFTEKAAFSTVEIFHASHGRYETNSPIRTFLPLELENVPHLLAAYTCTPLVDFSLDRLKAGGHVKGKTLAELGGGNRPLDMIAYDSGGEQFILLSNSNRTLMKIDPRDIVRQQGLTEPVEEPYATAGVEYISVAQVGVQQLDNLNDDYVIVIQRMADGALNLRSISKSRI